MADTAVIAIIAGATTTLGVPIVGAYFERERRSEERRDREVEAVKALLNEGSLVLEKLEVSEEEFATATAKSLATAKAKSATDTRPASEAFAELQGEAQKIIARLAIVLGRLDNATIAFVDASAAHNNIAGTFDRMIVGELEPEQADPIIKLAANEYVEAKSRFIDEATTLVGSHALRRRRRAWWPMGNRTAP